MTRFLTLAAPDGSERPYCPDCGQWVSRGDVARHNILACRVCGEHCHDDMSVARCFTTHPLVPGETDEDRARQAGSADLAMRSRRGSPTRRNDDLPLPRRTRGGEK